MSNFDMITRPLSFTTCHLTNANIAPRLLPTTAPTSNVLNGTKDAYMWGECGNMWSHLCVYVCVSFHIDVNQSFSWSLLFTMTQVVPSKLWFSSGFQLLDVVYSEARVNFVLAIFLATLPLLLCQQRIPTANETKTFCINFNRLHIGAGQEMYVFILLLWTLHHNHVK